MKTWFAPFRSDSFSKALTILSPSREQGVERIGVDEIANRSFYGGLVQRLNAIEKRPINLVQVLADLVWERQGVSESEGMIQHTRPKRIIRGQTTQVTAQIWGRCCTGFADTNRLATEMGLGQPYFYCGLDEIAKRFENDPLVKRFVETGVTQPK